MIERVIGAFNHWGFNLDDTEIADILWLAVQMRRCDLSPMSELPQETPAVTPEIDPNTKLPRDRQKLTQNLQLRPKPTLRFILNHPRIATKPQAVYPSKFLLLKHYETN